MNLSGQQWKQLQEALIDAFPNESSLEQMLLFGLDKNLDAIAEGGSLENISKSQTFFQEKEIAKFCI